MTVKQAQSLPTLKNKRSRKFRPNATESFVIVKPPPTVSAHHPLNLQIQYIPPATTEPAEGKRRTSSSSEKSETSNGSSSRSGRIVPLYNLHTHSHNLLSNSIHDAGTDDMIAKFKKQGLEIVNLGLFAPIEAWGTSSFDSEDVPSATKLPSAIELIHPASSSEALPEQPPPRKFLGKLFHSKASTNSPEPSPRRSLPDYHPDFALAPILGTTATLLSRTVPPQGRAVAHTWICKKWYKETEDWLGQTLHLPGFDRCDVDIRIEWARKRESETPSRKSSASNLRGEQDSPIPPVPSLPTSPTPDEPRGRQLPNLTVPSSPMFNRRRASKSSNGRTSDVEYDSDPEDSEVPWVCSVVIRASKSLSVPIEMQEPPLRLKVASLAPAPHHPKVVAQLKMQYPLPDVDLQEAILLDNRRQPGAPGSQPEGRFVLTAEELKDLVCSTSLWLVVREFGGLSKKCKRRLS